MSTDKEIDKRITGVWIDEAMDLLQVPSCILDAGGLEDSREAICRHVNPAFCRFMEKEKEKLIERPFYQLGIMDKDSSWLNALSRAISDNQVIWGRLYAEKPGKWLRFVLAPVGENRVCSFSFLDISGEEKTRRRLRRDNATDKAIIRAIRRLISEPSFSRAIDRILQDLSRAIHPDRLYILETDRKTISNTYEWCAPGVKSEMVSLQNLPYDEYMLSWEKCLETDTSVVIPDIEELRKQGDIDGYNILKRQNIRNLMSTPLYYQGKLIGFLVADNYEENEMMNTRYLLETVGAFMAMYVVNRRLLEQLEFASGNDSLTGVKNRNAMDIYFNRHAGESQLGVLFIDVNGLKYVNDTQGHAEGDRLLQNLAEFLCRYFPRDNIYRSGGDEFVIVTPGTTEEKMRGKTRKIKDAMQKESFSFAIGYAVSDHRGIQHAAIRADQRMYQDKREYYQTLPKYR
ncbi:MAG: GGDEF domain-containing protein [Veillonellaceae bacterium]|nr:MAG: GGDEF domain-containing protein [Veillonellaceae bacterium]PWL47636.1 MAG: GGDEF domain-containing protein [Veillonellaceae bacterium]